MKERDFIKIGLNLKRNISSDIDGKKQINNKDLSNSVNEYNSQAKSPKVSILLLCGVNLDIQDTHTGLPTVVSFPKKENKMKSLILMDISKITSEKSLAEFLTAYNKIANDDQTDRKYFLVLANLDKENYYSAFNESMRIYSLDDIYPNSKVA